MKRTIALLAIATVITSAPVFAADTTPAEQTKAAITKLKSEPNYSWTATSVMADSQFNMGPLNGKTEKDGFTVVSQEMNDNTAQAVWKGDKTVVKGEDAWEKYPPADGGDGGFNPSVFTGMMLTRNKTAAEEAETLLAKVKELKAGDGGVLSGDLTEDGAKDLLSWKPPGGGMAMMAKNSKGSAKFWVKDGALVKFESHLQGSIAFGQDGEDRSLDITRTVELKDVGTTKVAPPAEAKTKLEAK